MQPFSPLSVVSVGRAKGLAGKKSGGKKFSFPLWGIQVYTPAPRGDGVWTYRLQFVTAVVSGFKPSAVLVAQAKAFAMQHGLPYVPDVRQHDRCDATEIEVWLAQVEEATCTAV